MVFDFTGYETTLNQERELAEKKQSYRADALKTVQELAATFNFTAADLGVTDSGAVPAAKPKRVVPPKYRTPEGFEWTGRGRQPKAIADAIAAGHSLESMKI